MQKSLKPFFIILGAAIVLVLAVFVAKSHGCHLVHAATTARAAQAKPAAHATAVTRPPLTAADLSADSFEIAMQTSAQTKKPGLAILTAKWCGPCRILEKRLLPGLRAELRERHISLATVDVDSDPYRDSLWCDENHSLPQLVLFQAEEGNRVQLIGRLVGFNELEKVRSFLERPVSRTEPPIHEASLTKYEPAIEEKTVTGAVAKRLPRGNAEGPPSGPPGDEPAETTMKKIEPVRRVLGVLRRRQ